MARITFTDEQITEMKEMYESGYGLKPIAKKFYVSVEVIRKTFKDIGFDMRHECGAKKRILTNDEVRKIKTMYEMGTTLKKISEEIGTSTSKIKETLAENGIKERPNLSSQKEYDKLETLNGQCIDCNRSGRRCVYRAGSTAPNLCDYILMTGHSRGCDPHNCTKYIMRGSKNGKR